MPDVWTGEVVRQMHISGITAHDLAKKMGVSRGYISMILNSKRCPEGAEERVNAALKELLNEKGSGQGAENKTKER